jgi:hypothetical protein
MPINIIYGPSVIGEAHIRHYGKMNLRKSVLESIQMFVLEIRILTILEEAQNTSPVFRVHAVLFMWKAYLFCETCIAKC